VCPHCLVKHQSLSSLHLPVSPPNGTRPGSQVPVHPAHTPVRPWLRRLLNCRAAYLEEQKHWRIVNPKLLGKGGKANVVAVPEQLLHFRHRKYLLNASTAFPIVLCADSLTSRSWSSEDSSSPRTFSESGCRMRKKRTVPTRLITVRAINTVLRSLSDI